METYKEIHNVVLWKEVLLNCKGQYVGLFSEKKLIHIYSKRQNLETEIDSKSLKGKASEDLLQSVRCIYFFMYVAQLYTIF